LVHFQYYVDDADSSFVISGDGKSGTVTFRVEPGKW